eukprot:TRINITY_DN17477_c0_g1_i1.p1 TRINITY_DN17477_c0_g1~~TRINITY_DN17477_c0_g1_i1.p1  ORF type:complete len:287 (+),score=47.99 TRINITY_DN17477_c0_g1_i1:53-913(+)
MTDDPSPRESPRKLHRSAVMHLVATSLDADRVVYPRIYLAGCAELLVLALVTCSAITAAFNPEQLVDNPIKRMVGFNDPCVVWDAPPALYVAFIIFGPTIFLGFRYFQLDTQRALQEPKLLSWQKRLILVVNAMFAGSMCLLMGIFVVTPLDGTLKSMWLHSSFFIQLVVILMLTMALNYLESYWQGEGLTWLQWAALTSHVVATVCFGIFAGIGIFAYKNDGVPVLPPTFLMCIDYAWFLSLPFCSSFMPKADPIIIHLSYQGLESMAFQEDAVTVGLPDKVFEV